MTLRIDNLNKTYKNGVKALDDFSLEIPTGMFGLLGPNGAGKSTLMRTIATLQEPDSGSIFLGNVNVLEEKKDLRQQLGYLPQEFGVYPGVSAFALLDHMAVLKGLSNKRQRRDQVNFLLQRVNLYGKRKKAVSSFSGGMKQRFGIAQALLGNPQLIIVDEPTAGLDPSERNRFYNLLSEIGEQVIVILSTHIVEDVRELCSNMAIMNEGKLIYQGQPSQSIESLSGKIWQKSVNKSQLAAHQKAYSVISSRLVAGKPIIHIYSEQDPGNGFETVTAGLQDVYFCKMKGLQNHPSQNLFVSA